VINAKVKAIPEGIHTVTLHIVVRDAARATEWYAEAPGAEERSHIPMPGGKLMSVEGTSSQLRRCEGVHHGDN
jgi:uncharacterized glyoxalase superfamily protein PhnB